MSVSKDRHIKRLKVRRAAMASAIEPLEDRQLLSCVIDTRVAGGGKSVDVTSVGQVVNLEVWAVITGTDGTGSNDGFQSVAGSFLSTSASSGSVLGNMSSAVRIPYTAAGAQNGSPVDLDGDGDLDIGSNDPDNFTPYFNARAGSVNTNGGVVSGATHSFEIGTITFTVTNLKSGLATDINFRERGDDSFTGGALWGEDGKFTDSLTGSYSVGAPVVITDSSVVPTGHSVSGEVYNDTNGSGTLNSGETGLSGVMVYIDGNNNGGMDAGETQATTDANGNYSFSGLTSGAYLIRQVLAAGAKQTAPSGGMGQHITVGSTNLTGVNFGESVTTVATGQTISGEVYQDSNSNGALNAGETGLSSVTVYVDSNNNGAHDNGEPMITTDTSGNYAFSSVPAGAYIVRQVVPGGFKQTAPGGGLGQHITVSSGKNLTGVNFGDSGGTVVIPPPGQTVSGEIYQDANGNGKLDGGESGLSGVEVYLDANNNSVLESGELQTTTDANGNFSFTGVKAGAYIARQFVPGGFKQTAPSNGFGQHITVTSGQNLTGVNFGDSGGTVVPPTGQTVSGEIYNDANSNGKLDAGEAGLSGVVVYLDANNNSVLNAGELQTTTDANGNYSFTGVKAGAYIARQFVPSGFKQTVPTNNFGQHITVSTGSSLSGVNFGDVSTTATGIASISGEIFKDSNGNGRLDSGEAGLSGVTVFVDVNNNGVKDSSEAVTTTDGAGLYSFSNLPAGSYIVRQILPSGFKQITPTNGFGVHLSVAKGKTTGGANFGDQATAAPQAMPAVVFSSTAIDSSIKDADVALADWVTK